jgi:hypothetical protein
VRRENLRGRKPAAFGITQEELLEFRAVQAEAKELASDLAIRKRSLVQRVEAKAKVEPGPLLPQLTIEEGPGDFTADIVEPLMGRDVVAEIKSKIPPRFEKHFSVVDTLAAAEAG